jgi:hypothetical protein
VVACIAVFVVFALCYYVGDRAIVRRRSAEPSCASVPQSAKE